MTSLLHYHTERLKIVTPKDRNHDYNERWFQEGYRKGALFAQHEADFEELAAIYRAKGIPTNWDIFRAEILNTYLGEKNFDFSSYEAGFVKACIQFFEKI
ncbi:MAG: hypothetical protein JRH18_01830 [Deltaproteobacteria bacterium]|nr:hypothetical protein [Deltaproteobacteria bacterium]MBW2150388.1 hypothetical protein [Deltaproteobacteria bacterium]